MNPGITPVVCFGQVRVDMAQDGDRWITTTTDTFGVSMTVASLSEPSFQALQELSGIHRRMSAGVTRRN